MNNLTEQWKKGELPIGEYYLLYKDGTTDREYYDWANVYGCVTEKGFGTDPNDIEEVLAEVPSYDELSFIKNDLTAAYELLKCENDQLKKWCEEFNVLEVVKENTKLKELLKKCKEILWIEELASKDSVYTDELRILIKNINKVLQEQNNG